MPIKRERRAHWFANRKIHTSRKRGFDDGVTGAGMAKRESKEIKRIRWLRSDWRKKTKRGEGFSSSKGDDERAGR